MSVIDETRPIPDWQAGNGREQGGVSVFDLQYIRQDDPAQVPLTFTWVEWRTFRDGMLAGLLNLTFTEFVEMRVRVAPALRDMWDLGYREVTDLLKRDSVREAMTNLYCGGLDYDPD